jgi:hypothetical protein
VAIIKNEFKFTIKIEGNLMKIKYLTLILILFITGCGTTVLSSSEHEVITESLEPNQVKSQLIADSECAKYNKKAKLKEFSHFSKYVIFSCVNN